jgi:dipeptidase D
MTRIYENQFGKKPSIKVIHAGLECGIIKSIYPEMDMISFGPTIVSPHSPDEKVNIKSVSIFWEYLQAAIQNI